MAEYRGTLEIATSDRLDTETVGRLLDALMTHDGSVVVEVDRFTVVFSFDASDLPGWASGLVAAMPRMLAIGRGALVAAGASGHEVLAMTVERIQPVE